MRHAGGIHYAVLGVLSRSPDGVHGYALKRHCERVLGHFWHLNFGEIYRVLDRLAEGGLIEQLLFEPGTTKRKLYRITDKGRRSLDAFIISPPTDVPRPLRQELAVKLLFAGPDHVRELVHLIDYQRKAYMRQLHSLESQRRRMRRLPIDAFVTNLLIDGAELSVRAELTWLEDLARKLQERAAP